MFERTLFALLLALTLVTPAEAQNVTCATRPVGNSTNACASTAFVQNSFAAIPLDNGKIFVGNASNIAVGVTPSGDCTLSNTGVITCTQWSSSSTARAGLGLGGFAATTSTFRPDGTNVRVAISDTSAQLHYDNIVLGTASGGAVVEAPRITWKVPDYNSVNSGFDHPLGNIGANTTAFIVSAGADGPSNGSYTLPLWLNTQNSAGTETTRVHIAGGYDLPLIGVGTTNPLNDIQAASIQIHANNGASAAHVHFSNSDSDSTGSDGAYVGINASEQIRIWNYENQSIIFGVNNANVGTLLATGILDLPVGIRINGAAASNNVLAGNGTNFVSSALYSIGGVTKLGQSHIPFVMVSSGTMGNNGALSGITAVPNQYSSAYVYLPASAIEAGAAAGWYYAVFSSTTAATVYNNTYTSGTPSIPGSPTAFVTTGPGAYTQTTGSYITAYTMTVTGGLMGTNGTVRGSGMISYNNSAGSKAVRATFGGATIAAASGTTTTNLAFIAGVSNRGVNTKQVPLTSAGLQYTGVSTAPSYISAGTASDQSFALQLQLVSAATDTVVLESVVVELSPGV